MADNTTGKNHINSNTEDNIVEKFGTVASAVIQDNVKTEEPEKQEPKVDSEADMERQRKVKEIVLKHLSDNGLKAKVNGKFIWVYPHGKDFSEKEKDILYTDLAPLLGDLYENTSTSEKLMFRKSSNPKRKNAFFFIIDDKLEKETSKNVPEEVIDRYYPVTEETEFDKEKFDKADPQGLDAKAASKTQEREEESSAEDVAQPSLSEKDVTRENREAAQSVRNARLSSELPVVSAYSAGDMVASLKKEGGNLVLELEGNLTAEKLAEARKQLQIDSLKIEKIIMSSINNTPVTIHNGALAAIKTPEMKTAEISTKVFYAADNAENPFKELNLEHIVQKTDWFPEFREKGREDGAYEGLRLKTFILEADTNSDYFLTIPERAFRDATLSAFVNLSDNNLIYGKDSFSIIKAKGENENDVDYYNRAKADAEISRGNIQGLSEPQLTRFSDNLNIAPLIAEKTQSLERERAALERYEKKEGVTDQQKTEARKNYEIYSALVRNEINTLEKLKNHPEQLLKNSNGVTNIYDNSKCINFGDSAMTGRSLAMIQPDGLYCAWQGMDTKAKDFIDEISLAIEARQNDNSVEHTPYEKELFADIHDVIDTMQGNVAAGKDGAYIKALNGINHILTKTETDKGKEQLQGKIYRGIFRILERIDDKLEGLADDIERGETADWREELPKNRPDNDPTARFHAFTQQLATLLEGFGSNGETMPENITSAAKASSALYLSPDSVIGERACDTTELTSAYISLADGNNEANYAQAQKDMKKKYKGNDILNLNFQEFIKEQPRNGKSPLLDVGALSNNPNLAVSVEDTTGHSLDNSGKNVVDGIVASKPVTQSPINKNKQYAFGIHSFNESVKNTMPQLYWFLADKIQDNREFLIGLAEKYRRMTMLETTLWTGIGCVSVGIWALKKGAHLSNVAFCNSRITTLQKSQRKIIDENKGLVQKVQDKTNTLNTYTIDVDNLHNMRIRVSKELEDLKGSRLQNMQLKYKDLEKVLNAQKKLIKILASQYNKSIQSIEGTKNQLIEARKRVEEMQLKPEISSAVFEHAKDTVRRLEAELANQMNDNVKIQAVFSDAKDKVAMIKSQREELANEIDAYISLSKEKDKELKNINKQIKQVDVKTAAIFKEISSIENKLVEAEEVLDKTKAKLNTNESYVSTEAQKAIDNCIDRMRKNEPRTNWAKYTQLIQNSFMEDEFWNGGQLYKVDTSSIVDERLKITSILNSVEPDKFFADTKTAVMTRREQIAKTAEKEKAQVKKYVQQMEKTEAKNNKKQKDTVNSRYV